MEDVVVLFIPIIGVSGLFIFLIGMTPLGKAVAERIRRGPIPPGQASGQADVLEAVEQLRHEVAELAERVDFTERLVARVRDADRLGPPR